MSNGVLHAAIWFQGADCVTRELGLYHSLVPIKVLGMNFEVPKRVVLECPYLSEVVLQTRKNEGVTEYQILEGK